MPTDADIQHAAELIRNGGLVALPTETVYGLGAHALDADAVAKVFAAKARPSFDPLIVHVVDAQAAWALVDLEKLPAALRPLPSVLAEAFWPGPLTLVLPKRENESGSQSADGIRETSGGASGGNSRGGAVPGIVTSGLDTVGVRVPRHPVAQRLLREAGVPIAAPSANTFGGISPTRAEHVTVGCDALLDGGPCETGVESTVVGFAEDSRGAYLRVLRLGGVSIEALAQHTGMRVEALPGNSRPGVAAQGISDAAQPAPGMLSRHYAPRTPMRLIDVECGMSMPSEAELAGRRVGLLSLRSEAEPSRAYAETATLSRAGDLTAAAAGLFEAMHRLDALGLDLIVAQTVPETGLGRAINDRLRRAAATDS